MKQELEPNSIFLGIIIGFILTSLIYWQLNKGAPSCYDDVPRLEPIDEPCIPDYMGGCW